ncbi:bifunctional diaminohydroxyphosphoribosylaminopyrimidine deaminase/5-amino-6-(5-phosphoribosylamino)uracil reductase RibD [Clostridium oryzae]|uniref:Riboflavin biosynthesis protein RibD n=1 Tax=Clostridium oryzae TaxID=1450648 RepID=A0A1V4IRN2_9CLOT|nr:bifunctional diaminohydroxyphosphoribosylaminopyrimidine deaminase/5-amino-6-(5-phosphoribosylamino)uracil reductase RibD [Clostridium oryzae]OPJ62455.1 riboflavin biosynthesis protein RibD [Clostridium oryzae]
MNDEYYMKIALSEAKRGCGFVNPNPMVGAVIVKNDEIIGTGYHEKYGKLHAERNAIASCQKSIEGATMYVTLEPCCHYGKTPPCTEAIIESQISTVIIGSKDSNPLVAGRGINVLKKHGIVVKTGVLENECLKLNEVFFHYIKTRTPFVVMKYAMTLDGKIATRTGKSKWITGEAARKHVHTSRHKYSSIMVGIGTVLADDPMLNCRMPNGRNPKRIVCDTNLQIPLSSKIVETANEIPTYIATAAENTEKVTQLQKKGCYIINTPKKDEYLDLNILMTQLGSENIDSILLEGGSTLNYNALNSGIVNKIQAYIAPKIFGGSQAIPSVGGVGIDNPKDAFKFVNRKITVLGEDILLEFDMKEGE